MSAPQPEPESGAVPRASSDDESSEDGIFGAAGGWMNDEEEDGCVEVGGAQRTEAVLSGETKPENWKFKEKSYWEERFKKDGGEKEYEWLASFAELEEQLAGHLKPTDRILVVGCGNSPFSRGLYEAGYTRVVNLDFSAAVIEMMMARTADCTGMQWVEGDMTNMRDTCCFEDGSFDVVLDKAGMDALLVDEGDVWNPRQQCLDHADKALAEFSRVLTSAGKLVQITFAQPHFRLKYLDPPDGRYGWQVRPTEKVVAGFGYFCYVAVKPGAGAVAAAAVVAEVDGSS